MSKRSLLKESKGQGCKWSYGHSTNILFIGYNKMSRLENIMASTKRRQQYIRKFRFP